MMQFSENKRNSCYKRFELKKYILEATGASNTNNKKWSSLYKTTKKLKKEKKILTIK
jgi:hypothetical protein